MTTTILRKTQGSNNADKELTKVESPEESLGLTLSLSHTSNNGEVSWSSSEGSTYYSEDEQSLQRRQRQKERTRPVSHPKQDEDSVSTPKQNKNVVPTSVRRNDIGTDNRQSKDQKEENPVAKKVKPKKVTKRPPVTKAPKAKKKLILKDVENFPAVNLATGSEDLSQMDLLTSADTADVFCTNGIPFIVMANKKLYEKISAISSASSYETDDSSDSESDSDSDSESDSDSDSDSDSESDDDEILELNTERAIMRDEISDADSDNASVSEHSVTVISVSNASAVSSLACASLDNSSDDSDTTEEGNSIHEKSRQYQARKTSLHSRRKRLSHQTNSESTRQSLQIDSKVERIKERKKRQSDTEEKIKLLKEKIKNIQDLSNPTNSYSEGEIGHLSPIPSRTEAEDTVKHEYEDDKSDESESLMERRGVRESLQRNKPIPIVTAQTPRFDSPVPLVIPAGDTDKISNLGFDGSSDIDIEADPLAGASIEKECDRSNSILDHTKFYLGQGKAKVVATYHQALPIIQRNRALFQRKPQHEQILIVSIGVLSFIFFILLFIMLAQ